MLCFTHSTEEQEEQQQQHEGERAELRSLVEVEAEVQQRAVSTRGGATDAGAQPPMAAEVSRMTRLPGLHVDETTSADLLAALPALSALPFPWCYC